MKIGTGRVTKIILDFLNSSGEYTLISNEMDKEFIIEKAIQNNVSLSNMIGKKFKKIPAGIPFTGITIEQTT